MPIQFEKNTDAFLAVLTLVVGADDSGSLEERDFLFKKVKAIAIFGNPSSADFSKLLGKATESVYSQDPPDVDGVLAAAKGALTPDLRKQLVSTAAELIDADGADAREKALLEKIRRALG
jgi:hypothetical protein